MTWTWGTLAAVFTLWSFVPYVSEVRSGITRRSPLWWLIRAVLYAVLFGSQYARGGRAALGFAAAEATGCALICVLTWRPAYRNRPAGRRKHRHGRPRGQRWWWL